MFEAGTRCIHTSKWEKRKCRVVAYDGDSVVVKMERGGYAGVPEKSLTPVPAAPQQEVKQALAKGMARYGDAMQQLAKMEGGSDAE